MRYVMSDLHGRYDKFLDMLKLINFNENDSLYILGDIFDRGPNPVEILNHIKSSDNIFLIKGNHEEMFEKCYEDETNIPLWFHNGGSITYREIYSRGDEFVKDTYNYIKQLPLYLIVDEYILTHAGLYMPENYKSLSITELLNRQSSEYLMWDRDFISGDNSIDGYTVVVGHTPTITINKDAKIIHKEGKILIDCGAVFDSHDGKLSCLCLDNKCEFYV